MRTLTLGLIDGSVRSIEDGGERSFAVFGDVWREGNGAICPTPGFPPPPPPDSFSWDDRHRKAHLPDPFLKLEVLWIAGPRWTPVTDLITERRIERNGGFEREWQNFRVSCGGGCCFIGHQGRQRESLHRRPAGARQQAASSEWRKTMISPWRVPLVS
jgi:hypothetical protein